MVGLLILGVGWAQGGPGCHTLKQSIELSNGQNHIMANPLKILLKVVLLAVGGLKISKGGDGSTENLASSSDDDAEGFDCAGHLVACLFDSLSISHGMALAGPVCDNSQYG